jgi:hypothetical protein
MDAIFNPLWLIVLVILVLAIRAARRGWGWQPFVWLGGAVAVLVLVGVLTGLAILPDGVDIFTFLIGAVASLGATVYMNVRLPKA